MPFDLTGYPQWQRLVETKPVYRKAWMEGRFPPPAIRSQIQAVRQRKQSPRKLGPGDYLERLIYRITGEAPDRRCPCKGRIAAMNRWGVVGCEKRVKKIARWLFEEARKRQWIIRLPGVSWIARLAPEGIQMWSCRTLVRLAIRKARKAEKSQ